MKNKRIMVLGGAGFIGSHLSNRLQSEVTEVCVVDNLFLGNIKNLNDGIEFCMIDASDYVHLSQEIMLFRPEIIINLAVLPLIHSLEMPSHNFTVNTKIVQNLLELLRLGVYKRLIHFSSSEVYGSAEYAPMDEKHPLSASTPYAASKAAGDVLALSYAKTFGSNIAIIRPFNNYGPKQNGGSYAGIIPLTINRILDGEEPVIEGTGKQTRDYIFVEDTVEAVLKLIEKEDIRGEVFNVASGHDISVEWLVKEICQLMNYSGKIKYLPERMGDVKRHIANTLKAKDVLGFHHKIGMETGLNKTIDWYCYLKGGRA
jgi:UDP-glucose 4-epimerase